MSGTTTIPLVMTAAGPIATSPTTMLSAVLQNATALSPGLTVLPGGLIDDISGTSVAALLQADAARIDAINSVTPVGANAFVLAQLGAQFGIPQGLPTNTSAYVIFGAAGGSGPNGTQPATPGIVIPAGTVVSDGTYQYATQEAAIIQSTGYSPQVYVVATQSGTWDVAIDAINAVVSNIAPGFTPAVYNPQAGTPGTGAESVASYRSRVLLAGRVASVGTPAYVTTQVNSVAGVQPRLIAINQVTGGWQIVVGGGDNYAVANAIYQSVLDLATLKSSALAITNITAANPAVVTTNYNSNLAAGSTFTVTGATPSAYNVTYTVASVSGTAITTTTDSSAFGAYTGGATFSPNPRNITTSISSAGQTYSITYVNPPQQTVTIAATWNTNIPNYTAASQVASLAAPALQNYINAIQVGQPINLLDATAVFQSAVESALPIGNLTTLTFAVTIDGVLALPTAGTSIIPSDPEGYFYCSASGATVTQG